MEKENNKYISLEVTEYMCHKFKGVFMPGDYIIVSQEKKDKPRHGDFVLISLNENQWIEKYWPGLRKRYKNIYLIVKTIINT